MRRAITLQQQLYRNQSYQLYRTTLSINHGITLSSNHGIMPSSNHGIMPSINHGIILPGNRHAPTINRFIASVSDKDRDTKEVKVNKGKIAARLIQKLWTRIVVAKNIKYIILQLHQSLVSVVQHIIICITIASDYQKVNWKLFPN